MYNVNVKKKINENDMYTNGCTKSIEIQLMIILLWNEVSFKSIIVIKKDFGYFNEYHNASYIFYLTSFSRYMLFSLKNDQLTPFCYLLFK